MNLNLNVKIKKKMNGSNPALERIKEQPRALCHAPLTNIQKSPQGIFATLYFVRSFFDYLFLQRFTLRNIFDYLFLPRFILRSFLTFYVDFDYVFLYI